MCIAFFLCACPGYAVRTAGAQTPVGVCACRQCSQFFTLVVAAPAIAAANAGEQKDADQPITAAAAVVEQAKSIATATAIIAASGAVAIQEEQQDENPDPTGDSSIVVVVASAVGSS